MKFHTLVLSIAALGFVATPVLADHHMAKAIKTNAALNILTNAKGLSLYIFDMDKAGDVSGDGMGGVWHLAKP